MLYVLHDSGPSLSLRKSTYASAGGKCSLRLFPPNARLLVPVTVSQKKRPASRYFASPERSPIRTNPKALGTCVFACILSRQSTPSESGSSIWLCEKRRAASRYFLSPDTAYASASTSFIPPCSLRIMACICSCVRPEVRLIAQSENARNMSFASS